MTRLITHPAKLAYEGVLIERPCDFCDTTDLHFDNLCQQGPCRVCGVARHEQGRATHPLGSDGTWSGAGMHDWTAHEYLPADFKIESPAFKAMLREVRRQGWPMSYTSDLFRDYQNLTGTGRVYRDEPWENRRFIWVLRSLGTHMFQPDGYGQGGLSYHADNEPSGRSSANLVDGTTGVCPASHANADMRKLSRGSGLWIATPPRRSKNSPIACRFAMNEKQPPWIVNAHCHTPVNDSGCASPLSADSSSMRPAHHGPSRPGRSLRQPVLSSLALAVVAVALVLVLLGVSGVEL